ncbi:hypothetical protein BASA61_007279 [Batrachochytrium salamandrivorans]|nr:hypothetical protein BASA61_007279 [Batrachochytrium salamandrivorans]
MGRKALHIKLPPILQSEAHNKTLEMPIKLPGIQTMIGTRHASPAIGGKHDLAYSHSNSDLGSEITHLPPLHHQPYYSADTPASMNMASIMSPNRHTLIPCHYDPGSFSLSGVRSIEGVHNSGCAYT